MTSNWISTAEVGVQVWGVDVVCVGVADDHGKLFQTERDARRYASNCINLSYVKSVSIDKTHLTDDIKELVAESERFGRQS